MDVSRRKFLRGVAIAPVAVVTAAGVSAPEPVPELAPVLEPSCNQASCVMLTVSAYGLETFVNLSPTWETE